MKMHSSPPKGQSFSSTPPTPVDYWRCKDFFLSLRWHRRFFCNRKVSDLSGFTIKWLMVTTHRRINFRKSQAREKATFSGI